MPETFVLMLPSLLAIAAANCTIMRVAFVDAAIIAAIVDADALASVLCVASLVSLFVLQLFFCLPRILPALLLWLKVCRQYDNGLLAVHSPSVIISFS